MPEVSDKRRRLPAYLERQSLSRIPEEGREERKEEMKSFRERQKMVRRYNKTHTFIRLRYVVMGNRHYPDTDELNRLADEEPRRFRAVLNFTPPRKRILYPAIF